MDPYSMAMMGLGGVGGLLGGQQEPELDPRMARIYKMLMRSSRSAARYGRGVPGSDPQEQAIMTQALAGLGSQQGANNENYMAALRPGDMGNAPDMMKNLGAQNTMQSSNLMQQMLTGFMGNRQNMRYNVAPGLAQSAMGAASSYKPQTPNGFDQLAPMLGQLAYFSQMNRGTRGTNYGQGGGLTQDGIDPFDPNLSPNYRTMPLGGGGWM